MVKLESRAIDVEVAAILADTKPIYIIFKNFFVSREVNKTKKIGNTISQKDKFKELTDVKLPKWEAEVLLIYTKKSAEYHTLFSKGRSVFNKGKFENRINYLNAFVESLADYPQLSTLLLEVKSFRNELVTIRKTKNLKHEDMEIVSSELKIAAKNLAIRFFKNLALLSDYYAENPSEIQRFFPMRYLIKPKKAKASTANIYSLIILANNIAEAGINFTLENKILIGNVSNSSVKVWFAQSKDITIPAQAIEIPSFDEIEIIVKNYAGMDDRFMMIANLSANEQAEVEITLLNNMS
jgi:hypothetical protein